MDTDKLFWLAYYKFLEQYGELYFLDHPLGENLKTRIKKYVYKKKPEWHLKKPYWKGEYAIESCEKRRTKRYPFTKKVRNRHLIVGGPLIVAMMAVLVLLFKEKITVSEANIAMIAIMLSIIPLLLKWDNERYKNYHGNIVELSDNLHESKEILQERSALLMRTIQNDICVMGYEKEAIIDRFIEQCKEEIRNSKINNHIDKIKSYILPFLLGVCFLLSDKLYAIKIALGIEVGIIVYLFCLGYYINSRDFNWFTREELYQRAVLDCLYYIKLKKFNLKEKSVSKKVKN